MTESPQSKNDLPLEASIPDGAVPLESILCTEELHRRLSRPPDYGKENRALVALVRALADSPGTILQTLAEKVLEILQADSAGLSLLTKDEKRFYWAAIAGAWKPHIGGGTPRDFGPCGDVLDRNVPMLFTHWERRYPHLRPATPLAEEGLLVPFYVKSKAVGTIWAIAHNDRRKFDAEDLRLLESLGRFASAAYQAVASIDDLKFQIAAREKAEAALRELATGLEAKIRRLVNANIIGIVIWNVEGRIIEANEAFLRTVGYSREDLLSGRVSWREVTPDKWRAADEQALAELAATGVCEPFEKEYFRKDGSRVPVLVGAALLEGSRDEGVAFVLDLTEQKRAEHALRESEIRLQAFFENSPSLIFLKDLPGRYLYVNKEFKRAFRITEEQTKGKRDDELFSAEQAATFQANDRQVIEAGVPIEFEEVALQEDGLHTSIVHKFPLFNAEGEIYSIGGIATDITERKREESARRYSEERHRVIVETASDAVISADESGTILLANPATTRVFGYDPAELIGKPLTILMPEYMQEQHEFGFRAYMATGQRHINWEGTERIGRRKNGEEFPVEVSFGELNRDGHRAFTGFIRDISEKKRAEEALQAAQAELAHVARVTTMGELAASISHEINQPLAAIVTNAKVCLRWLMRDVPNLEEVREATELIARDGKRASDIISRIRALVRKTGSEKAQLDINQAIEEVVHLTEDEALRKGVVLRTELAGDLPFVLGDRVQLQQVLLNLIINGVEAMSSVADGPRELLVYSRLHESNQVLVGVQDSGVGIEPENLKKIFDPFYTTKSQGMGMGLAISRSIVENHGGKLWASPNDGPGATFKFALLRY
jgi:PAS domain S-box-containing protein